METFYLWLANNAMDALLVWEMQPIVSHVIKDNTYTMVNVWIPVQEDISIKVLQVVEV